MITINASEIAALVGKNPYKDPEEAIQNVLNRNVHHTPDVETQRALDICKESKEAQRLHQEMTARSRHTTSSSDAARVKTDYHSSIDSLETTKLKQLAESHESRVKEIDAEFGDKINTACTRGQKTLVEAARMDARAAVDIEISSKSEKIKSDMSHMKNVGTRKTNTSFGTRHEDSVGDMYEAQTGLKINKDNIRKYWEFMPGFGIVGYFDGFNEEGTLVEIKNRMRRLFGKVVDYEKVQVHVYMAMARKTNAQLIERFQDQIQIHEIEYDQEFMGGVMNELKDICKSYF
tara:strand:+ start:1009 stop:1878 length:870 start_codon:yes stop_codon:yes gene_type:complete